MKNWKLMILLVALGVVGVVSYSEMDNSVSNDEDERFIIDLSHLGDAIFGEPDEAVGTILKILNS